MSLIIKGMKMPKNGEMTIAFASDENGENTLALLLDTNGKPIEHKGVAEIPTPHGRLIDADKLQTSIHGCLCETCETFSCEKGRGCLIEDVFNLLDEAPTVIKAEVSE